MNKYIQEKVNQWILKANNDLKVAKNEMTTDEPITDAICFHSQQCVEKYLKAFLTYNQIHVGKTHNIIFLVEMCKKVDNDFDYLFIINTQKLNDYSVEIRYPDEFYIPTIDEAREAIEIAKKVRDFVLKKLKERGFDYKI